VTSIEGAHCYYCLTSFLFASPIRKERTLKQRWPMTQLFERTFVMLSHEADLTEGCLSVGLTHLRKATVADKHAFYTGFLNTSIAFERLMKLIVVCDHMLDNDMEPPSKSELKSYGHDLTSLYVCCKDLALKHGISPFKIPVADSIESKMLSHFTKFARFTRYYNLDTLKTSTSVIDPLSEWSNIIEIVIKEDVPGNKLQKRLDETQAAHAGMKNYSFNINHDMHGNSVDLLEALSAPVKHDLAAPYIMKRVFNLLMPVMELLSALGEKGFYTRGPNETGPYIPIFSETLGYYMTDPKRLMKKKKWP